MECYGYQVPCFRRKKKTKARLGPESCGQPDLAGKLRESSNVKSAAAYWARFYSCAGRKRFISRRRK